MLGAVVDDPGDGPLTGTQYGSPTRSTSGCGLLVDVLSEIGGRIHHTLDHVPAYLNPRSAAVLAGRI